MPSLLNLSRIMIFNVHTWLPVTLFNLRPDQEIYRFNYSLMTSQLRRGGKKGQHIFENVNLNNVFWVCWKKAIIKCHLGPTASSRSLSLSFSLSNGNRYNMYNTEVWVFHCLERLYAKSFCRRGLFIGLCLRSVLLLVMHWKDVLLFDGLVAAFSLHESKAAARRAVIGGILKRDEVLQIHSEQITCTSQRLLILSLVIKNSLKLKCSFA